VSVFGAVSRLLPKSANEALAVSCVDVTEFVTISCDLNIYPDILL
jgi:hypothetical protein